MNQIAHCKLCGIQFNKIRTDQLFCCARCRDRNYYNVNKVHICERNKALRHLKTQSLPLESCVICGKDMSRKRHKYCSKECFLIGKRKRQKRLYSINKHKYLEAAKRYQQVYKKRHRVVSRKWEGNHVGKVREIKALRGHFGTANLPLSIKIKWAFVHIGYRLIGAYNTTKINKAKIQSYINQINKGDTYVAYE